MHEGQHSVVAVKFPLILSGWVRKQWHLTFNCLTPAAAAQLRLRRSNQSTPNFPGRCSNRWRSAHNNISKQLFDLWSLPTDDSRGPNPLFLIWLLVESKSSAGPSAKQENKWIHTFQCKLCGSPGAFRKRISDSGAPPAPVMAATLNPFQRCCWGCLDISVFASFYSLW